MKAMLRTVTSLLTLCVTLASAKTVEFDWKLGWKKVNPDGLYERYVVAINDEWPLPVVRVSKGDRVIVRCINDLGEPYKRNSTLHFHGLYQNGTNDMDGPSMVTQCPQPPDGTSVFLYNFTVEQNGTYWYHTHVDALYPDGYRQLFLVDDDEPYFKDQVDGEFTFSISDWYHDLVEVLKDESFMTVYNPTGAEPVPQSLLINDTTSMTIKVKPNSTYRLRIANIGALTGQYFFIYNHKIRIVEVDGVYVDEEENDIIYLAAAQRYSVLFTTGPEEDAVYQMVQCADIKLYDTVPSDMKMNVTSWLVTKDDLPKDEVTHKMIFNKKELHQNSTHKGFPLTEQNFTGLYLNKNDDSLLVAHDRIPLYTSDNIHVINTTMELTNLLDGVNYAFFDGISYTPPVVPTLYSLLSAPDDETAVNETIYGRDTHTIVLKHMEVVQLILNNNDDGLHPFHLHGHNFQVLWRPAGWMNNYGDRKEADNYFFTPEMQKDFDDNNRWPEFPVRRDVLNVNPHSHFVVRWIADNPGVWIFHCHIDWHLSQGLAMIFVEAPLQIRQNMKIIDNHIDMCKTIQVPYEGNAGANTKDFFDLSKANYQVDDLPAGFTARGIVALVFSCICAFLGMATLTWYGLMDTKIAEHDMVERVLDEDVPDDVSAHRVGF